MVNVESAAHSSVVCAGFKNKARCVKVMVFNDYTIFYSKSSIWRYYDGELTDEHLRDYIQLQSSKAYKSHIKAYKAASTRASANIESLKSIAKKRGPKPKSTKILVQDDEEVAPIMKSSIIIMKRVTRSQKTV